MPEARDLLDAAETVARVLERHGIEIVVIGAIALAAHGHVRYTEDIDLGVNADLEHLRIISRELQSSGFVVELREPDPDDPLGGVIDVSGAFGLVQIINFADRFPAVIRDAFAASNLLARPGSPLRLSPIPHLVALKLYAGGHKSKADILELIARNPQQDLDEIRRLCAKYRLPGFDAIIANG